MKVGTLHIKRYMEKDGGWCGRAVKGIQNRVGSRMSAGKDMMML